MIRVVLLATWLLKLCAENNIPLELTFLPLESLATNSCLEEDPTSEKIGNKSKKICWQNRHKLELTNFPISGLPMPLTSSIR